MSRTALIRNGVVEHVIMAANDFEIPEGMTAIRSNTAGIGDKHDGVNFHRPEDPDLAVPQLVNLARRRRQLIARYGVKFNVGTHDQPVMVKVSTHHDARMDLGDHAYLASRDIYYRGTLVDEFGIIELSGQQFLDLERHVALFIAETHKTLASVVTDINSGRIRKKSQIDKALMPNDPDI